MKTELEAMRAGSAADYHARKQVLTKKKVLAQEAVQARKVDRLTELRAAREAVLSTLELAHTKHTQAQARCDHLKQRLAAAKQVRRGARERARRCLRFVIQIVFIGIVRLL